MRRTIATMAWRLASHSRVPHSAAASPTLSRVRSIYCCSRNTTYRSSFVIRKPLHSFLNVSTAAFSDAAASTPSDWKQYSSEISVRLVKLLKLRLPDYCSGCGVKLQQEDPDGPGWAAGVTCTHVAHAAAAAEPSVTQRSIDYTVEIMSSTG